MKKNSFFTKKPNWDFIAFLMVFCCFFANTAMAQDVFTWKAIPADATTWANAGNWDKVGLAGTDTYPGETRTLDQAVVELTPYRVNPIPPKNTYI